MGDFVYVAEIDLYDKLFQHNVELWTTYISGIMTMHRIAFIKTHWVVHIRFVHRTVQMTLKQCRIYRSWPPHSRKSAYNFWLSKNLAIIFPWYVQEIGSRTPAYSKIHRCSNPLHKLCRTMHTVSLLYSWILN